MMENNYNVKIDTNYIASCQYPNKIGMYPTFDILEEFVAIQGFDNIVPTAQTSTIIGRLVDELGYSYNNITMYYKEVFGYRNCCLPISVRYNNLTKIYNRIRLMWIAHDMVNATKFDRLITTITQASEISPLFNKHRKWEETEGKDITGTITSRKTGTETLAKNDSQVHSGTDTTTLGKTDNTSDTTVNGVTSFDQSAEFVNNDNTTESINSTINSTEGTTYGKTIANTGTDTTTHNTTTSDSEIRSDDTDRNGDEWISEMSLAEAQKRELALNTILDQYFASVAHDICLCTLEEIW